MDVVAYVFWIAVAVAVIGWVFLRVMRRQCPECRQWVDRNASRCRHCTAELG